MVTISPRFLNAKATICVGGDLENVGELGDGDELVDADGLLLALGLRARACASISSRANRHCGDRPRRAGRRAWPPSLARCWPTPLPDRPPPACPSCCRAAGCWLHLPASPACARLAAAGRPTATTGRRRRHGARRADRESFPRPAADAGAPGTTGRGRGRSGWRSVSRRGRRGGARRRGGSLAPAPALLAASTVAARRLRSVDRPCASASTSVPVAAEPRTRVFLLAATSVTASASASIAAASAATAAASAAASASAASAAAATSAARRRRTDGSRPSRAQRGCGGGLAPRRLAVAAAASTRSGGGAAGFSCAGPLLPLPARADPRHLVVREQLREVAAHGNVHLHEGA